MMPYHTFLAMLLATMSVVDIVKSELVQLMPNHLIGLPLSVHSLHPSKLCTTPIIFA